MSLASVLMALAACVLLASPWVPFVAEAGNGNTVQRVEAAFVLQEQGNADARMRAATDTAATFGYELRSAEALAEASPATLTAWARRTRAAADTRRLWEARAVAEFVAQHPELFAETSVVDARRLVRRVTALPGLALIVFALTLFAQMRPLHPLLAVAVVAAGGYLVSLFAFAQPATLPGEGWGAGAFAVLLGSLTWLQAGMASLLARAWLRKAPRRLR